MSTAKTSKEKQAALRERRKQAGFRQLLEWVHDEDRETLRKVARELRAARFKILGVGG